MILRILTFSALVACSCSDALAQDAYGDGDDAILIDEEFVVPEAVPGAHAGATDPYAALENVEVVLSASGEVQWPWISSEACVQEYCALQISSTSTGEVAFFDGTWFGGFIQTGRGEQVIRVLPATE